MLTNEQCIEVAEKVWGWTPSHDGSFYGDYGKDGKGNVIVGVSGVPTHTIVHEVNSWEGFGRTAEAMANNDYKFTGNGADGFYFSNDDLCKGYEYGPEHRPKDLISSTHLAALEAMK